MNPNIPIVFHSIRGDCKQPKNATSYYNTAERDVVIQYVSKLLKGNWLGSWKNRTVRCTDIGFISPYRIQCDQIYAACCAKGYDHITVGSAEVFQGQERPIMLISTVRTKGRPLGFLQDQRVSVLYRIFIANLQRCFFCLVFNVPTYFTLI